MSMTHLARHWLLMLLACTLVGCATPQSDWGAPEVDSAWQVKHGWLLSHQAVAAAHPLAAAAGAQVLRAGGSAVDAAVATQLALAVVEPQSSGLGGGALVMVWDGLRLQAWDGRETAPAAAGPGLFLDAAGRPLPWDQAVASGRSVGVPGTVRLLEALHQAQGRLPWARLFEPAVALAEEGFEVSPRLHRAIAESTSLRADAAARSFYMDAAGQPWPVGHRLRNPALAAVLRRLAAEGAGAFYQGPVAQAIVERVRSHAERPGALSLADLSGYRALAREPICTDWRQWRVCGFPPPSSGHLSVMQLLLMRDLLPPALTAEAQAHAWIETLRLVYADRAQFVADPDFVAPPAGDWRVLLAPAYLAERAAQVGPRAAGVVAPGRPTPERFSWSPQADQPELGTSHLSVVDASGTAVAMTTTIEAGFGSGLLCDGGTGLPGGFLLNNELTDFALQPTDAQGSPVANRVEGGKRPRSSMAPTLVFDRAEGRLLASLGSPGGAAIIPVVAAALRALADGQSPQQAADAPHLLNFNTQSSWAEAGRWSADLLAALRARGHQVLEAPVPSGLQVLARDPNGPGWRGGADPRREGVVLGD